MSSRVKAAGHEMEGTGKQQAWNMPEIQHFSFGDLFETLSQNLTKLANYLKCQFIAYLTYLLSETTNKRLTKPDRYIQLIVIISKTCLDF